VKCDFQNTYRFKLWSISVTILLPSRSDLKHCLFPFELSPQGLRPWNRATFSRNLSGRNNVVSKVEIVCWAYYHFRAQQILLLQKVDVAYTQLETLLNAEVVLRAQQSRDIDIDIVYLPTKNSGAVAR